MPDWLTKQYGPFTGTVWVVVIAGGVGLGLLMRRYMASREAAPAAEIVPVESASTSPAFMGGGGGTLYNQGEIVSEVLEALKGQGNTPGTTDPTDIKASVEEQLKGARASEYAAVVAEITRLQADRNAIIADMKLLEVGGITTAEKAQYAALKAKRDELATRIYALAARREFLRGAAA